MKFFDVGQALIRSVTLLNKSSVVSQSRSSDLGFGSWWNVADARLYNQAHYGNEVWIHCMAGRGGEGVTGAPAATPSSKVNKIVYNCAGL